jgi:tetrahydromethanopterin S-methyltransferase subunit G
MTSAFNGIRATVFTALLLALGSTLGAQSNSSAAQSPASQTQPPSAQPAPPAAPAAPQTPSPAAPAQTSPAAGASSTKPDATPAPGTTPVAGDQPATAHSSGPVLHRKEDSSTQPSDQSSAPGTAPVSGDQSPAASGPVSHQKGDSNKQTGDNSGPAPGVTPVKGDVPARNTDVDPDKVVGVGSDLIKVKPGSIEDVNAVGNRDIGGRGLGNWYSTDSEIKMGKQYADEIEKTTHFITDPVVTEYVNRIGQNIVKNSDCKVPFTIKVIDSDEINAMALPGGFFYVNSGLLLNADEEAEIAGVMAHEIAHVCAHHAAREMTRMNYAQIGSIPLIMMTGYSWTGYGIYEASQLAIPIAFLQFSRDFEAQADYLGVQYMYRAGYDPQAFIAFFEKIQALEKRKPGLVSRAFSDHPQTPDRILHSQEEIARILPAKDEYLVTTSEFDDVKARLARIENKRRLLDNKGGAKPSLRRTSTTTDNGNSTASDGSGTSSTDGPTLHRRDDQN